MFLIAKKHLIEAMRRYPDAAKEIKAWAAIAGATRWQSFLDVRRLFHDADYVDGYVIFNIRQNRYRLITVIHYAKTTEKRKTGGHVYIRSVLTRKEYNDPRNWDRMFGGK